jgi:hypothetical protein
VIFAERIKLEVLRLLNAPDQWQGKFYLTMHPARQIDEEITASAVFTARGWNYHLELPNQVTRGALVGALVPLLLAEIANRTPGDHAAEVPRWLGEGLAARVLASEQLVLANPEDPQLPGDTLRVTRTTREVTRVDSLAHTRALLRAGPATVDSMASPRRALQTNAVLRLDELGWPSANELSGSGAGRYRGCAELLVHELLQLRNGPEHLRRMLDWLPVETDWQSAFLRAFAEHFPKLAEAEKWWAVTAAHFLERDAAQAWSPRESLMQLDAVLQVPVEVRLSTNDLPLRTEASLQTMIRQWLPADQATMLRRKRHQLQLLQGRISPHLATLLNDYQSILRTYQQALTPAASTAPVPAKTAAKFRAAAEEATRRLDLLDLLREDMKRFGRDLAQPADGS